MAAQINYSQPMIMHIDLNSCFAIIEQQANPLIRHRPVAIVAYEKPYGMVLASSYEAKALGIKLGVNVREARKICPDVIIMTPDPEKYFDAHRRFKEVLLRYTSEVVPKSVDEFVVDFRGSPAVRQGISLVEIGHQIKADIRQSLGEYVTVNVGIGPSRFLAKLAAGLHKPDGLDTIDARNLLETYDRCALLDLPGINVRYQARLNTVGIYTPRQFFAADLHTLHKRVFKSIVGLHWYYRLRGHEMDDREFGRKSFGQQYALEHKTAERDELLRLYMKLCEKAGRRMRKNGYLAHGIQLWLRFEDHTHWTQHKRVRDPLYSTLEIYTATADVLKTARIHTRVTGIGVTVFNLTPSNPEQLGLFVGTDLDARALARAADIVNDRYGEFTLVPARMTGMKNTILKRVAFGNIREE